MPLKYKQDHVVPLCVYAGYNGFTAIMITDNPIEQNHFIARHDYIGHTIVGLVASSDQSGLVIHCFISFIQ